MNLRAYIIRRAVTLFVVFLIILSINFMIFRLLPGDPVRSLFQDPRLDPEDREQIAQLFGLDKPIWVQYLLYMKNALVGELGMSFTYRQPVWDIVAEKLENTIILVGSAAVLAFVLGITTGIVAAWRRKTATDFGILGTSLFLYSVPTFWLGMMLLFALGGIVPSAGMYTLGAVYDGPFDKFADLLKHLAAPVIVLTCVLFGQYVMLMRSSLIDVLQEDFIVTARAKGMRERFLLRRHAFPNAMLPIVTITAINMGFIVGGAIQTETIFSWPGVGRLMFDALMARDYPILQGCFIITTLAVLVANFVVDITYVFLDPRVRIG